jgi:glycerophosphoryl diester phosphodiesterase
MKKSTYIFFLLLSLGMISCHRNYNTIEIQKRDMFLNLNERKSIVVAHRGDWRNAPENSLKAIQNCILMGADVVELDIRMTRDSVLVLMHDETIDRTTTGNGVINDMTYDTLQKFYLKNGASMATEHKVPTFKEALLLSKNKIWIDMDIKTDVPFEFLYRVLRETKTSNQVLTISYRKYHDARAYYGTYLDSIIYIPGISNQIPDPSLYIQEFEETINPVIYAPKFSHDTSLLVNYIDTIIANGDKVWIHTITADRSGNHHDDRAVYDIEGSYGWLVDKGVSVFQTDRPGLLIQYLESRHLRD